MHYLKVSGAVRPLKWSLGVKWLILLFHYNNGYTNAPQCYVIRTLPALLNSDISV